MDLQILNLLFRYSREFSHEKFHMEDLSETEWMICSYISSHPLCSQDDVASALRIDKTTVAKALVTLENKDCIGRRRDAKDRRVKRLTITERGYFKIGKLMNLHSDWLSEVMSCLTPEEQAQFETYCNRLLESAERVSENHKSEVKLDA